MSSSSCSRFRKSRMGASMGEKRKYKNERMGNLSNRGNWARGYEFPQLDCEWVKMWDTLVPEHPAPSVGELKLSTTGEEVEPQLQLRESRLTDLGISREEFDLRRVGRTFGDGERFLCVGTQAGSLWYGCRAGASATPIALPLRRSVLRSFRAKGVPTGEPRATPWVSGFFSNS
ncbi:hypothetical protein J3R74_002334 [Puniceicoccus vermicola]